MFKKLFSCLGDNQIPGAQNNNGQQVDLSGQGQLQPIQNPSRPIDLHAESNINGQEINFTDAEDFTQSNLLQMHFKNNGSASNNNGDHIIEDGQQKYYYMMDDGEVESKITTASPSKNQYYNQQKSDNLYANNPHSPQQNIEDSNQGFGDLIIPGQAQNQLNQSQIAQLTEKKLNNYLQQAKYLISASNNQNPLLNQESQRKGSNGYITNQDGSNSLQMRSPIKGKTKSTMMGGDYRSPIQNHESSGNIMHYNATEIIQNSKSKSSSIALGSQTQVFTQQQIPTHLQNIYQLESCPSSKILLFNPNSMSDDYSEDLISRKTNQQHQQLFSVGKSNLSKQQSLKNSFNNTSGKKQTITEGTKQRVIKNEEQRKSYSDKKLTGAYLTVKQNASHKKQDTANLHSSAGKQLPGYNTQRSNNLIQGDFSGSSRLQAAKNLSAGLKSASKQDMKKHYNLNTSPNQIIDKFENMMVEYVDQEDDEETPLNDNYNNRFVHDMTQQLRVLDYEDDQDNNGQMDLGHIKSINKRQTSKTEVFSPVSMRQKLTVQNNKMTKQPSNIPNKNNMSKGSISGNSVSGKKPQTSNHLQIMNEKMQKQASTRNNILNKKHMTTTTSPNTQRLKTDQKVGSGSLNRQSNLTVSQSNQKLQTSHLLSKSSHVNPFKHNTMNTNIEIIEDQNEDEDYRQSSPNQLNHDTQTNPHFQLQQREFDIINQTISPSSSSKFQFQPKFFKPTNLPTFTGKQSQSMEEPNLHYSHISAGLEGLKRNQNKINNDIQQENDLL
eukprot:403332116